MTRILFSAAVASVAFVLLAAEQTPLWPEGKMPHPNVGQSRVPYLEWSEPPAADKKSDTCCILISGGGYNATCDGPAFKPLERKLLDNGITCVWLWYRIPRPQGLPIYQTAWEDAQRAVRIVRSEAAKRGYDSEKIGALGCSAGSHACLLLATSALTPAYERIDALDDLPCHLNYAIPMCPAYVLTDGLSEINSREGDSPDVALDTIFKFDAKTAPLCLFHGGADPISPLGSTFVYRKLRQKKVPAELHFDPDRVHGPVNATLFERAIEFLRQMDFLKREKEIALESRFDDSGRAACEKEDVWPKGLMPDAQTNQCVPYIEWHTPKTFKTKAIQIIYSGGGYGANSPDGFEVRPARRYLNDLGMTVVTLKYRVPRPSGLAKHVTAWQDLQRTIRIVRSKAASKGLDPNRIGIMGSSAGGHLTLMGATSARHRSYRPIDKLDALPCNVQWAIAIYPAYALTDGIDVLNKNGGNDDAARLVPEFSFDLDTCPTLFIHGDADGWAAMNSVKCWEQMRRMGIQSELHTLAKRSHCFQRNASPGTGSYTFLERITEFLTRKGFNK